MLTKTVSLEEFKAMYPKGTDMPDIKAMAVEAGIDLDPHGGIARAYPVNLERFAQLVAEDCAQAASEYLTKGRSPLGLPVAKAIRARFGLEG